MRPGAPCGRWLFLLAVCLAAGLSAAARAGTVLINEVVALNDTGLADEDGDRPDWLEVFNGTPSALNLAGYGLSDDADKPFKWVFPIRTLPSGGFIIVFASGKNRTNTVSLHTSFSIQAGGERLFLTRPDGLPLDEWPAVAVPRDYSLGRQPDGGTNLVFFASPTPGAPNATPGLAAIAAPPLFSHPAGFRDTGFDLLLGSAEPGAEIRYTLDGSEPTGDSLLFSGPVPIRDRSGDSNLLSMIPGTATVNQHTDGWFPPNGMINKATTLRARAFRPGAWPSPVVTQTYFIFTNALQRYALPVVSIAVNTNDLFNYNTGIYVLGKIFTDYTNAHPTEPLTGHTPANYTQRGDAWGRRAHLEYFEPGAGTGFAQNVIVDIQGQSSRSFRQKSLGVKARSDAPPVDTLAYDVWPGLADRAGQPLRRFPNLRLSNSGNDWNETLYRDALCHRLCAPSGIDTLAYRPVVVFLDGEYWGIHNAREQLDPGYAENHYGVPSGDVVICETIGVLVDGRPGDEQHFLGMRSFIETNDLTQATNYAWVQTQMDVGNFIAYQASEIYIANADWPHNNIRFWRKRTTGYETNAPPGHDGRWRWALFDTDLSYGHSWSGGYGDNTLAAALSPTGRPGIDAPWSTAIFRGLITNSTFRRDFINTYADLLNSAFKENRADAAVVDMQSAIAGSMAEHIYRWRTMGNSWNGWSNNVRIMRTFASQRPIYCRQHVVAQFGLAGYATLTLNVSQTNRGRVRINTLLIDDRTPGVVPGAAYPWRGTYFRGVPIQLQAVPSPGYVFVGWSNRADLGVQDTITANVSNNVAYTAMFERSAPHDLALGPYVFSSWDPESPAGSYPAHMRFEQTSAADPGLGAAMDSDWLLPYNRTNRSRINGLGAAGVAFLNTSSAQADPGAGFLGSALLAVRTVGVTNVEVSWVGGTVSPNERIYAIRLQFAVADGPFQDVLGGDGQPVEYVRAAVPGQDQLLGPVVLPSAANGQPYVTLRWKYYYVNGNSGSRAQLRLDDILVRPARPLSPATMSDVGLLDEQWLQFEVRGTPHGTYQLDTSTNLTVWQPLGDVTTDLSGRWFFSDAIERAASGRFYRVRAAGP